MSWYRQVVKKCSEVYTSDCVEWVQPVFSGEPDLSVVFSLHGKAVLTECVHGQGVPEPVGKGDLGSLCE